MARTPAPILIRQARMDCEAMGAQPGAYTPIVFERYEFIGGERGFRVGHPSETVEGYGCIVWTHHAAKEQA